MTNTPYSDKFKNSARPRYSINGWVFLLALLMLLVGVVIGGAAMWVSAPTLLNQSATQAAYQTQAARLLNEAQLLAATQADLQIIANDLDNRATQASLGLQATGQALNDVALSLQQTATQASVQILATQAAAALQNAQQMTQVNLDYSRTQAALQQNATQAQLSFMATQAALQTPVLPMVNTPTPSR